MTKSFYVLIALFLWGLQSVCAQGPVWEKISSKKPIEETGSAIRSTKAEKDGDYNFGAETNPSPRTDAVTWADPNGGVWIYGGIGYDETKAWGIFADLWKYEPLTNQWTLIWGDRNKVSAGEKARAENPLPRKDAGSWMDRSGNLWMFGGRQLGDLNHLDDFWKFDVKTKSWSKLSGKGAFNQKADRGALKSAGKSFYPGSRSLMSCWTDKSGNFWLYGGLSYTPQLEGRAEFYSDLWMFDVSKEEWQWVSGKDKVNQATKFDSKNSSKENSPSPRAASASWYDESDNRFYLYGGMGYDSSATIAGGLSDMWVYTVEKDNWEQLSAEGKINSEPTIANILSLDKGNSPGFRISPVSWQGPDRTFFLASGQSSFTQDRVYIDKHVWVYSVKVGQWRLIPQNEITISGSGSPFIDAKGNLYIFGGKEFDQNLLQSRPTNAIFKLTF